MRRASLLLLSSLWKDHSEHIMHLIALSTTDKKMLEHARSYIHNIDLRSYLADLDDIIDLTSMLTKVDYPKRTQVPIILQQQVCEYSKLLEPSHINHICGFIKQTPESFLSYLEVFFSVKEFVDKFGEVFKTMDLEDITSFSSAVAKSDAIMCSSTDNSNLLFLMASAINDGIDRANPSQALSLLQKCAFPLWKHVKKLALKIEYLHRSLSSEEFLCLFFSLEKKKANHREFIIVYQQLLCRRLKEYQFSQLVRIFETILLFNVPIREKVWLEIIRRVSSERIEVTALENLCACVNALESNKHSTTLAFASKLKGKLEGKIVPHVRNCKSITEDNVNYLLCYAYVSPNAAKEIVRKICSENIDVSPLTHISLCKLMLYISEYRQEVVSRIVKEPKKLVQDEYIFVLNAVFQSGLVVEEKLLEYAVGSFAYRQFSSRSKIRPVSLSSTVAFLLLRVLCHLDSTMYDRKFFPFSSFLQISDFSVSQKLSLLSASIENNKDPNLSRVLLFNILSNTKECNQKELQIIFLALAALRVREALIFTKLLQRAKKMEVSIPLIITIAKAAHSLKLLLQFSQSNIVESTKKLSGVSFETLIELLKYCTIAQREHIISIPEGAELLKVADLGRCNTSSLLILSNTSSINRKQFHEILKTKNPLKSGDVTSEEVILSLEKSVNESETKLILRICGSCLTDLDERQLMRIFRRLIKLELCPNIAFRILGRSIMRNINSMTPDESLQWLNLYVKYEIRDDGVVKVLLRKTQCRKIWGSKELEAQVKKAKNFYGVSSFKASSKKEHNTAFFSTTL